MAILHIFCLFALESSVFFSLQVDPVLLLCTTSTQRNTNIALKEIRLYKILKFALDFPIIVTFIKKALQIICATNECDRDFKKWRFLLKQMVTKKCVTQPRM
jgi:hypothetical protein